MENVHSKNDKANLLIYLIGMSCFLKSWSMTKLDNNNVKPTSMKTCNLVYLITNGKRGVNYIGFDDKTETLYKLDCDSTTTTSMSYDEALKEMRATK